MAGRLRSRALPAQRRIYFRTPAWSWRGVANLGRATLTSVVGTLLGAGATGTAAVASAGVQGAASAASAASKGDDPVASLTYAVDTMFRSPPTQSIAAQTPGASTAGAATGAGSNTDSTPDGAKREVAGIFNNSLANGPLANEDQAYAAQILSQRTGISRQEAETRVSTAYDAARKKMQDAEAKAKAMADTARKNAAYAALWIFVSLLLGAFSASLMATYGGRRRDLY